MRRLGLLYISIAQHWINPWMCHCDHHRVSSSQQQITAGFQQPLKLVCCSHMFSYLSMQTTVCLAGSQVTRVALAPRIKQKRLVAVQHEASTVAHPQDRSPSKPEILGKIYGPMDMI